MLLDGVEGGLTELQGDAFTYKDVDQRTLRVRIPSVPVLYINRHSADFTRHSVCDTTKNKDKAMRRVLARLRQIPMGGEYPLGDHRYDVLSTQEVNDYLVTFEELAEMVEWVWTMYAPGGLLLSKQEQKEAFEEFEKWRTTGTYWDTYGAPQEQPPPLQLRLVPFLEFSSWFTHLTIHIERLRGAVINSDTVFTILPKEVCQRRLNALY